MPGWNAKFAKDYGHSWTKLRAVVLHRDRRICQCSECKATGRIRLASEVDHILPKAKGGNDDLSNLQAIHPECHRLKSLNDQGYTPRAYVGVDGWPMRS